MSIRIEKVRNWATEIGPPLKEKLSGFVDGHGNLLRACLKITTYNNRRSARFSESWSLNSYQVYLGEGADAVIQSARALGFGREFLYPLHCTGKASGKDGIRLPIIEKFRDFRRFKKVFDNGVHKTIRLLPVTCFVQLSQHCLRSVNYSRGTSVSPNRFLNRRTSSHPAIWSGGTNSVSWSSRSHLR